MVVATMNRLPPPSAIQRIERNWASENSTPSANINMMMPTLAKLPIETSSVMMPSPCGPISMPPTK
ncbi:hypothetical protein D3C72_687740 [compost metagenome]